MDKYDQITSGNIIDPDKVFEYRKNKKHEISRVSWVCISKKYGGSGEVDEDNTTIKG